MKAGTKMSNTAFIETFECRRTDLDKNTSQIEVRAYDDYNRGDSQITPDSGVDLENDLDILQYCKDYGSDESKGICDVIDSLLEYAKGVIINGTEYNWEEIKHIFKED